MLRKLPILFLLAFYVVAATLTIAFFNGTGDGGDSVMHYIFAFEAPSHPELYFHHWAKPVFVLLASPFAQFGFVGIKVFNAIVVLLTIWFSWRTAELLKLKNTIVVAIILVFTPLYYILTFSGLTEPLFALFVSLMLFFTLRKNIVVAALIVSFLPLVRSEGLIVLGVYGLYLLWEKKWKAMPVLLVGHIVYSFAGWFVYRDLLWVFTQIPYAHLSSPYGSGGLLHFVNKMFYVVGLPIYLLFIVGMFTIFWQFLRKKSTSEVFILVFLGFLAFFVAHTLFFYLGIFHSMGLMRVLLSVMPFIAIAAIIGFNLLEHIKLLWLRKSIQIAMVVLIVVFPFTKNPAAIRWEKDMKLSNNQKAATLIAKTVLEIQSDTNAYLFSDPYTCLLLQVDYFDTDKHQMLEAASFQELESGDFLIWEHLFANFESGISAEYLANFPGLEKLQEVKDEKSGKVLFLLYRKF